MLSLGLNRTAVSPTARASRQRLRKSVSDFVPAAYEQNLYVENETGVGAESPDTRESTTQRKSMVTSHSDRCLKRTLSSSAPRSSRPDSRECLERQASSNNRQSSGGHVLLLFVGTPHSYGRLMFERQQALATSRSDAATSPVDISWATADASNAKGWKPGGLQGTKLWFKEVASGAAIRLRLVIYVNMSRLRTCFQR